MNILQCCAVVVKRLGLAWKKELTAEKGILTFKIFAKSLMSQSGFLDAAPQGENPDF